MREGGWEMNQLRIANATNQSLVAVLSHYEITDDCLFLLLVSLLSRGWGLSSSTICVLTELVEGPGHGQGEEEAGGGRHSVDCSRC